MDCGKAAGSGKALAGRGAHSLMLLVFLFCFGGPGGPGGFASVAVAGAEEFWRGGEFWPGGDFWTEEERAFMYGPVPVHPSPEPFTLNGYDAVQAVWLIRRAGLLLWESPGGTSEIIAVRESAEVRAVHVGTSESAPGPQHRERYDILVNGEPLDWRNTFIRYGGRMVNLQALFSYRNQTPPEGLRYRLDR